LEKKLRLWMAPDAVNALLSRRTASAAQRAGMSFEQEQAFDNDQLSADGS
jgi:hypothetical protein